PVLVERVGEGQAEDLHPAVRVEEGAERGGDRVSGGVGREGRLGGGGRHASADGGEEHGKEQRSDERKSLGHGSLHPAQSGARKGTVHRKDRKKYPGLRRHGAHGQVRGAGSWAISAGDPWLCVPTSR